MNKLLTVLLLVVLFTINAQAQVINANPSNYISALATLTPGDTLLLASGNYTSRLNINNMNGTMSQPIVIMGSGNSTTFLGNACCNTVSIKESSYITLQDFTIDGQNLAIDGVKAEGTTGNWAHHIILDNLLIIGHGVNQQTVGISTKCPAWDWIIRGCTIDGAGTGIYLGNSNGELPFVNGIIEYNLIKNTLGYNLQVKHQNVGSRNISGMTLNGKTIIRHNVLSKESNASSGSSARPNLLVGHFPASGDGANDHYEIYGNLLWQNPTESLFQGNGNIAFYDNVCVNYAGGFGIAFQPYFTNAPKDISIFQNTIINSVNWGIRLMDTDVTFQKYVYGNAVFSNHATPIRLVGGGVSTANLADNIVDGVANANNYVNYANNNIATIDLYPKTGSALNGSAIPNTLFNSYTEFAKDFNSSARNWNYRGAYSGESTNTGWQLAIEQKPNQNLVAPNANYCTVDNRFSEVEYFNDLQIESVMNITYGNAVNWQGTAQDLELDIFYPALATDTIAKRPFILLIHGGGFFAGNKSGLHNDCREFAKRGFVAATMSYRLGWNPSNQGGQILAIYRAQQDASAALRYIVNNAASIRVDTAYMFCGGQSAGAITSLNTAYLNQVDWAGVLPGIETLLGPLNTSGNNLTDVFTLKGIYNNWGATHIPGISPNEMVPTISFHGVLDQVVQFGYGPNGTFGGSEIINNILTNNGVCSELVVDSLGGHGIYGHNTQSGDLFRAQRVSCFFKSVFCDDCTTVYLTDSIPANCATIELEAKAFLEGPYDVTTGLMRDDLRSTLLPTAEPYQALGFPLVNSGGETTDISVLSITGNNAIVDWVLLELRDQNNPALLVATQSALLQRDGDIVATDGVSPVLFSGLTPDAYFVTLNHRNHLSITTASPFAFLDSGNTLDFSDGSASIAGVNPQVDLGNGILASYTGDATLDDQVNAADRSETWNLRNQAGYFLADVNLDGVCNAADRSITWNNRNKVAQ